MEVKVFYSWESDLPVSTNREFILNALEVAAKSIRDDETIEVEPVVDRDTLRLPGSPDIASAIFAKIDQAQVFVCDISIINADGELRRTPNPNVLIELGYAIKALGWERVIMVSNTAYGEQEVLPFDLRTRRSIAYVLPDNQDVENRTLERQRLQRDLEEQLRTILAELDTYADSTQAAVDRAKGAIEHSRPDQEFSVRDFMKRLVGRIDALNPDLSRGEGAELEELLVQAIAHSQDLVIEFAELAQTIAAHDATNAALAIYRNFGDILTRYYPPPDMRYHLECQFDFYKFIGHELFVTFFSFLVREERWQTITTLFEHEIYVENTRQRESGLVPFQLVSQYVQLLETRRKRLSLGLVPLHAVILGERHSKGNLGQLVPLEEFMAADYFLFLRAELPPSEPIDDSKNRWFAWSAMLFGNQPPKYLVEALREEYAQSLLRPLSVPSVQILRARLNERARSTRDWFPKFSAFMSFAPFEYFDFREIGSR